MALFFCTPESMGKSIYRDSGENILEEENMLLRRRLVIVRCEERGKFLGSTIHRKGQL
jgi:hypothetical protein